MSRLKSLADRWNMAKAKASMRWQPLAQFYAYRSLRKDKGYSPRQGLSGGSRAQEGNARLATTAPHGIRITCACGVSFNLDAAHAHVHDLVCAPQQHNRADPASAIEGHSDPNGGDGYVPGAWDAVRSAYLDGHISDAAYDALNAVRALADEWDNAGTCHAGRVRQTCPDCVRADRVRIALGLPTFWPLIPTDECRHCGRPITRHEGIGGVLWRDNSPHLSAG